MSEIYAPDYLRKQSDTQLHSIADMIEKQMETMSKLCAENAELKAEIVHLKDELKGWMMGADSEAHAGDEARAEANQLKKRIKYLEGECDRLQFECDKLEAKLIVLRRYHGGDGTVTREDVMKALGEDDGSTENE